MDAKLSRFFHRILLWTPRLFDAVERGHASSEYPLGVRRMPDGTRVRLKLVAERVEGRGAGAVPVARADDVSRAQARR